MMNDFNGDLFDMAATPERAKWAEEQPGDSSYMEENQMETDKASDRY
jgi:hypothetical protein